MTTLERVVKILADFRDFDANEITGETTFEQLGLDSLDVVDLVMKLEDEFGMSFPMKQGLKTLGNLTAYIDESKN